MQGEPSLAEATRPSSYKSATAGRSEGSPRLHSGLGSPRPRARSRLPLSPAALPADSPTASGPQAPFFCSSLGGGAPWPRRGLRATPAQLPDPRWLPSERVRGQQSADGRPLRPGPASRAQDGRRQGRLSPATIHFPILHSSAGKPSLPSVCPSVPPSREQPRVSPSSAPSETGLSRPLPAAPRKP